MSNLLDGLFITLTLADRRKAGRRTKDKEQGAEKAAPAKKGSHAKAAAPHPKDEARGLPPLRFDPTNWTPLDRLTYVGRQECPCCGSAVRYVAGDLIRYFQNDKVGGQRTIRTRAFSARDQRFAHLPRTIQELPAEEHVCPACLYSAEIISGVFEHKQQIQMPLVFPEDQPVRAEVSHPRSRGKYQHKPNFDLHQPV